MPISAFKGGSGPTKKPYFRGGARPQASATSVAPGSPTRTAAASPRVALYNNLNSPGLNAGVVGETPPDSTGAIGPNNYVEIVNSRIAVYDRNLNLITSSTLDAFIGSGSPYCDVQMQWDPAAGRWLFEFLYCNPSANPQGFVVGWSRTSDPSQLNLSPGGWCGIAINTGTFLFDYPKLGHNSKYLMVGGNFYDVSVSANNPPFAGSEVAWVPLPSNGDTTCPSTVTVNGTNTLFNGDGTTQTFTPVPVNTDSSATDGYVISAYDPAGNNNVAPGARTLLSVWHLDSAGTFHQDPDVTVNSYSTPPSAVQAGTADRIDTLDGRLTQAVGDPTTGIWTQHTVLNSGVSKVTWYELALSGPSMTLSQEGDVTGAAGEYIFNAAISPSYGAHGAAIFYNRSSASIHPLIAAQIRVNSTASGTMVPGELVLATSPAPDTDFSCNNPTLGIPCRWGDYSGASPDPIQTSVVWGTNELNAASGPNPAWQDENFAVTAALPPIAPTGVSAVVNGGTVCVSWTPSAVDDGAPDISYKIRAYSGGSVVKTMIVSAPASSSCQGLAIRTTYTFTVSTTNVAGESAESAPSNAVTMAITQSTGAIPSPRSPGANQGPAGTPGPR